jgi:hypothetical protein
MTGIVVELLGRAGLHDLARVHDRRPLADLGDDRQVVGDQDQSQAEVTGQPGEQLQDLGLHHDVERGGRLVRQQDLRLTGERHRDRGALPHATGELVRVPVTGGGRDAHHLQQLAGPLAGGGALRDAVEGHRLGDLPADLLHRVQGVHRALEHHGHVLPPVRLHGVLAARQDVLPVDEDLPGGGRVRRQQSHEREDGGGLPAARLADQAEPLPRVEREAHPLHRVHLRGVRRLEPDVQAGHLEQAHMASGPRPTSGRSRHGRIDR